MLNKIFLMGRLTRNPELRYTGNETPVCSFTLAVDRDYQTGGSERQTDFVDCVAWRKTAEFVSKYWTRGQLMVLEGALQSRKWKDKNDETHVAWEVVADTVYFGGDKKSDGESAKPSRVDASTFEDMSDDPDAELPF